MKFAWQIGLAAFLALGLVGNISPTWAAEDAPAAEDKPAATEEKAEEAEADKEFAPASVDKGLAEVTSLLRTGGPAKLAPKDRYAKAVEMVDKMWDMDRDEGESQRLMMLKFQLLMTLDRMGNKEAGQKANSFLASVSEGSDEALAVQARKLIFSIRISKLASLPPEEQQAAIDEIKGEILAEKPTEKTAALATQFASSLSYMLKSEESAKEIGDLADHFKDSGDEKVEKAAASLIGMARRMSLPGKPIELTGTTLNGEDLNFPAAFKGKTVVVDFWATWCGPCIAEFPNMKKLYAAYHPHGFEIIGISLDDTKPVVEKFVEEREIPWTIVWNDKGDERGWSDVNSVRYGITGIPTMIFVGKDGNVVSITARGHELDKLLAEAYPDVKLEEEKPEAEAKVEKAGQ
ncbi:TlpA family protein disulfide reductase [Bremerella cremea]|nr:TlpA disulfide reductase family protein [Bremerella cremea]